LLFFLFIFFAACNDRVTDALKKNQPPETHLFLQPDNEIAMSTSRQILHWWGDDADGRAAGFVYTFDGGAPEMREN